MLQGCRLGCVEDGSMELRAKTANQREEGIRATPVESGEAEGNQLAKQVGKRAG